MKDEKQETIFTLPLRIKLLWLLFSTKRGGYAKMGELGRILPKEFVRVGRSQIINTKQVLSADGETLRFTGSLSLQLKTHAAVRFFYNELTLVVKKK